MVADAYDAYYEYLDEAKDAGEGNPIGHLMVKFRMDNEADAEMVYNRWRAYDTASNSLVWEAVGKYGKVARARLNDRYEIFLINWDGTRTKGKDDPPYKLYNKLPGMKVYLGHFDSVDDAKAKAVGALTHWLYRAGLASIGG